MRRCGGGAGTVVVATAMVVGLALAACSATPPVASNAVPPPATAPAAPIVWAALGGDETVVADPESAAGSWTQQVLSRLPASAQLLNVASQDASVLTGLEGQVGALEAAGPTPPTVATVWFGADEPQGPSDRFATRLTDLVQALRDRGVARIVLVSQPDAPTRATSRFPAEVEAVASATGAQHVSIPGRTGPDSPAAQAAIADLLTPAVLGR